MTRPISQLVAEALRAERRRREQEKHEARQRMFEAALVLGAAEFLGS